MKFFKMQAAGNDFVLINGIENEIQDYSSLSKKLCDRHFGIGADGLMSCEKTDKADIKMVYYNSDGSKGEMCGNGIRCFSKFIYDTGIVTKDTIDVKTAAGIKRVFLHLENGEIKNIKVGMGKAIEVIEGDLTVNSEKFEFSTVIVGVPHTVIFTEKLDVLDVNDLGRQIEVKEIFPNKTNVNFVEVINENKVRIKTWERGAGRTLACGTGSCATVIVGHTLGILGNRVEVITEGGQINVTVKEDGEIYMEGTATTVFKGEI
ncbi:MAG: diaminopimelate epimerase [Cetobacterium sp.]|uniref:diaminopimelate epimerase n=1 Tax=unclassified Cetobacterium TaxID=2630983 RepID=UPI00163C4883|nr:diaminopimelate epimerase [Cetobacterium sp. 2A]MBC2856686.1 diaminopimelate epimerase [Cetobacterium sp. 2A]